MILAFISAIFWASFDIVRKKLSLHLSPQLMTTLLSLVLLPIYLIYWLLTDFDFPVSSYYIPGVASGVCAMIGSISFIAALNKGKFSVVIPVLSLTPILSGVFAYLLLNETLSFIEILAVFFASLGCFILLGGGALREKGSKEISIAVLAWSLCIVFDKMALTLSSTSFHLSFVTFVILTLSALIFRPNISPTLIKRHFLYILIAVVVFGCAVTFQFLAVKEIQPGILEAIKRSIGVISSTLLGIFIFKEQLKKSHYLAISILFVSGLLLVIGK